MYKVLIRPLSIEDASVSFQWRNDPEIWQYTGNRPDKVVTLESEKKWLWEKLSEKDSFRFAIMVDDKYIGNIQITHIIEKHNGQYHIFIGEKSFWGKGIAKQATSQIIRFAKEKLNLKEIFLIVNPDNIAAIKLYEKSGFVQITDEIRMNLDLLNTKPPIVSVFILTYNHEKFIEKALEGVLMQKTNFDYEIVIGEDCSTDNMRKILLKYADKYPGKFNLLLHERNIGAMANQIAVLQACTGKYIAMCEGDDYWTDPAKLEKQINFLEANPDFVICHHKMEFVYEDDKKIPLSNTPLEQKEITTIEDLARGNYINTASCVFRNGFIKKIPDWFLKSPAGDYPIHILNSQYGKIKYFPKQMGVYRIHRGGTWSSMGNEKFLTNNIKVLELLLTENFPPNVIILLKEQQRYYINRLLNLLATTNWEKFMIDLDYYVVNDEVLAKHWLTKGFPEMISLLRNSRSFKWGQKLKKTVKKFK